MNQKINNIQGLRAFAAIAVVSFHTGLILPHMRAIGSFGVDVFFVISGYIMARICETNSSFFLRRRLIRIVPPYWVMTALLFLAALKSPQLMGATRASGPELLKSLLFIPYFKSNGLLRPLLFVGWSLNYEMFFYLAIALGLLLYRRHALLLASAVVLATAALCHGRPGALPVFYGNGIMIEFVLGIAAYEIARRVPESFALRTRPGWLAVTLLCMGGLICQQGIDRPELSYDWIVTESLCMILILSASLLSRGGWDLRVAWLVLIGDASYILYLIHPYCEYSIDRLFTWRFHHLNMRHPAGSLFVSALSIVVAVLIHVYVERPTVAALNARFGGKRRSSEFRAPQTVPEQVAP
ncbi:MAG TPA: acyltransferase [Acidobacteriaceae bacterium]